MDQSREELCIYYKHMGECAQNLEANHWHFCQCCNMYEPRINFSEKLNNEKLNKDKDNKKTAL